MKKALFIILLVVGPIVLADVLHSIYPPRNEVSEQERSADTRNYLEKARSSSSVVFIASSIEGPWDFLFGSDQKVMAAFTVIIAIFTVLLAFTTKDMAATSDRQERSTRTIERAYVKMSHEHPGIRWFEDEGSFTLPMRIENFGNTPADITDILLCPKIIKAGESLPEFPTYERERTMHSFHAFLVSGEHFTYHNPELFTVSDSKSAIESGRKILYIIGYVDYRDAFGVEHRAGYAREYIPKAGSTRETVDGTYVYTPKNNLAFVIEAGYNYDEKRKA